MENGTYSASLSDMLNPFGLKDGRLVHVDEVSRGLECGCACPACSAPLVAKKGGVRMHHFAHAKGENCAAAYETALHIAAKEILQEHRAITLPLVEVKFSASRAPIVLSSRTNVPLDSVLLEHRLGSIVPDVLATVDGQDLLIEIKVTHAVDERKIDKIRSISISAIEIDLSDLDRNIALVELKKHVVGPSPRKTWLHNVVAQRKHDELVSSARFCNRIDRGLAGHIDWCPLPARVWRGKPYANIVDDCLGCRYALAIGAGLSSVTCAAFDSALREQIDELDGA